MPQPDADRRKEKRMPEELVAVMTDNAVAAELIKALPEAQREDQARWVAEAEDRQSRARRAVDVVRRVIESPNP